MPYSLSSSAQERGVVKEREESREITKEFEERGEISIGRERRTFGRKSKRKAYRSERRNEAMVNGRSFTWLHAVVTVCG